nr:MAG TPA: hypothetical protein [Crassvirales sp.]
MRDFPISKRYIIPLDDSVKRICSNSVAEYGIDKAIENQLHYLDCTRIVNGLRLMQTIGTPYQYEMSKLAYILDTYLSDDEEDKLSLYYNKIAEIHKANLKYEKDNPPIIYDKSKKVKNARTTRKKVKEATIDGFENSKIQQKSLNADIRKAILGNIKLKIK